MGYLNYHINKRTSALQTVNGTAIAIILNSRLNMIEQKNINLLSWTQREKQRQRHIKLNE